MAGPGPPRRRLAPQRGDERAELPVRGTAGGADGVDGVGDGAEQVAEDLAVQAGFALEVVVNERLVGAGGGGDPVDGGAVEAAGGELGRGRGEEPPARRRVPPGLTDHLVKLNGWLNRVKSAWVPRVPRVPGFRGSGVRVLGSGHRDSRTENPNRGTPEPTEPPEPMRWTAPRATPGGVGILSG
jgi:hypothetical protein